ncbi:MAG: type II toxin-antitoxin system Phd/YefM family antitoxin [Clostridia bacterium]|nr:type II toxin-antitoxin system Phd/YefM family antitoxin [Clostridia bacterium]
MTQTDILRAKNGLYGLVNHVLNTNDVVRISTKDGDVVMLRANEYKDMIETMYLLGIPGMRESIVEGLNTSLKKTKDLDWRRILK